MTAVITAHDDGGCIRWCDAKCYTAVGPVCRCICGGKNHGVGIHKALENCETIEEWLAPEAIPHKPGETISIVVSEVQIPLPLE